MSFAIEVVSISKQYPKIKSLKNLILHPFTDETTTAIEDISFQINEGELFGFLGPNGAGKTTLIRILCTTVLPTSGTAYLNGYDVVKDQYQVRNIIGLVTSDERSFFWRLTGRQNLEFFAALYNIPKNEIRKRIDEMLKLLELNEIADNRFKDYSTGTKQKMAIARGLINNAKIILMDEPTKGLDVETADILRSFIKNKLIGEDKRTVLLTTHHLHEAEKICDKIAIIDRGKIKAFGTLEELRNTLIKTKQIHLELNNYPANLFEIINKIDGVIEIKKEQNKNRHDCFVIETIADKPVLGGILTHLVNKGIEIKDCFSQESSLEEIFKKITIKK